MKIETIYCDICGYKFSDKEHWASRPAALQLNLQSPPRQQYESRQFEHVCFDCIEAIQSAVAEAIKARKLK